MEDPNGRPQFVMTYEQALRGALISLGGIGRLLAVVMLALAHLALAVGLLAFLWWRQVTPVQAAAALQSLFLQPLVARSLGTLGVLGVSWLGALTAYLAGVRWLFRRIVSRFALRW